MGLYSNNPFYAMSMMMMGGGMMGGMGGGMMGGGMMGGGMMGGGMMGGMGGMYGGGMMGGGMPGMMGGGYGGGMPGMMGGGYPQTATGAPGTVGAAPQGARGADLTGSYLGTPGAGGDPGPRQPRIVPNPFDNSLLIQGTRQEYESILKLLRDIDVPPRQVLVEAKIYEVNLSGRLRNGVQAFLTERNGALPEGVVRPPTRSLVGSSQGAITLSAAALVGQSRELLAQLASQEFNSNARIISAPSVIATDSVPATINVGNEVPTLTSQALTGAQQGGDSLFANSIQSRNSGVTLNVLARVNPMGVVTMTVNQEVSAPIAPDPGAAIQSPSFSKRTVQTQITLQDGDTIAIGGIINEDHGNSSVGIPFLHRIPILGYAFGSKAIDKNRTELIIFLTPKVIYDMNNINEATDELKSRLKKLSKYIKEEQ
jgi:general secretion pathway protein D